MADETSAVLQLDNAVISAQFVFGAVMSAMAYWIKRQDNKIDKLEKEMASKVGLDTYNATLEALRKDIRESSNQSMQFLRDATKQITDATDRVNARIDNLLTKESK